MKHPVKPSFRLSEMPVSRVRPWLVILVSVFVFIAFFPSLRNDFINFDDGGYITNNAEVKNGLSWKGFLWAFTTRHMANWHPLTWLSHMADVSLFGLNAGGHHFTSLLFHVVNTILVFIFAERLLVSPWSAAFVALLFGIHPLHVESVAWVSERKDVLSACFWFLSLIFYMKYTATNKRSWYAAALVGHGLGLLAKPMGVTLPAILILLDMGPLGRVGLPGTWKRTGWHDASFRILVMEKIPFALMSLGLAVTTFLTQQRYGAVIDVEYLSLPLRLQNAVMSYLVYLGQTVLPTRLAFFYMLIPVSLGEALAAGGALVILTASALAVFRRQPLVSFGWFWYLVTLIPVIGIVQVGSQAHADRYTYIPLVGIFLGLAQIGRVITKKWPRLRPWIFILAGCSCIALAFLTSRQAAIWKNSETLTRHALQVTEFNYRAHNLLGGVLMETNRLEEAAEQFRMAAKISSGNGTHHANLGLVLMRLGRTEEAVRSLKRALELPNKIRKETEIALAEGMIILGHPDEGLGYYSSVTGNAPDSVEALRFLGEISLRKGRYEEAIRQFEKARRVDPSRADIPYRLGLALAGAGRYSEAVKQLEESLALNPDSPEARKALDTVAPLAGKPLTP